MSCPRPLGEPIPQLGQHPVAACLLPRAISLSLREHLERGEGGLQSQEGAVLDPEQWGTEAGLQALWQAPSCPQSPPKSSHQHPTPSSSSKVKRSHPLPEQTTLFMQITISFLLFQGRRF